jgi:hypothetical protein
MWKYTQYSQINSVLGLDRSRLIQLAYLLGSDYTDGVSGVATNRNRKPQNPKYLAKYEFL